MQRWVVLAGEDPRNQAGVGGQDLVGADHREPVAERHDDRRRHAGQLRWEHHVFRYIRKAAVQVVVPVHPEQVQGIGGVAVDARHRRSDAVGDPGRVSQLGEGGQEDAAFPEPVDAALVAVTVDQFGGQSEAGGIEGGCVEGGGREGADSDVAWFAHERRLATGHRTH